jgi:membrane associated rhomboid family serine protease
MFFIPLRTDSPLKSTPYMNWLLIAANIVVYVATCYNPEWTSQFELHSRSPALLEFITYQFLHANVMHIAGNMLFLYIFGNNVNDKMGHLGYLAFYLAGGIVAGVCYTLTEQTGAPIIGASGAIAAVTGAYLILFPRSLITIVYWFFFIGRYEIQSLWFILAFFALDLFGNFAGQDGVAHMAHIGGTIFGSAVCLSLVVCRLLPRDQWDVWALMQRWNKRRQFRGLVSKGYNPFDYTEAGRDGTRQPENPYAAQVQDLREKINAALSMKQNAVAATMYVEMMQYDNTQVLSRQAQLDVATQLHHDQRYAQAADAYEKLLRAYPKFERADQIELMVGILYSRYLHKYDKARQHLARAIDRLHEGREMELAREELSIVESHQVAARS